MNYYYNAAAATAEFVDGICRRAITFIHDEDGDTNFLSIIIVLAIALVVAAVFIGFKDQIVETASSIMDSFMDVFKNQTI